LQIELRYTNYLDCGAIDERRPQLDPRRLEAAQARLRPAFSAALAAICQGPNGPAPVLSVKS
jgi:hypothetical protein